MISDVTKKGWTKKCVLLHSDTGFYNCVMSLLYPALREHTIWSEIRQLSKMHVTEIRVFLRARKGNYGHRQGKYGNIKFPLGYIRTMYRLIA